MPRKVTKSLQRKVTPDRKYQSVLVQRLINKSMLTAPETGRRASSLFRSRRRCEKAQFLKTQSKFLEKAIANVSPDFEVKSRRVGGANYQIPFPIAGHRQQHFAFSWLVQLRVLVRVCLTQSVLSSLLMLTTKLAPPLRRRKTKPSYGRSQPCLCSLLLGYSLTRIQQTDLARWVSF